MKALYIHGFNSAGFGGKVDDFRRVMGAQHVISPNLPTQPVFALELLNDLVSALKPGGVFLVGSSLGGYYSLRLAFDHQVKAVLINPALKEVAPGLRSYLGTQTNYKTGESYQWTESDLEALQAMELKDSDWPELKPCVRAYLDRDDELLPASRHAEFLQNQGIYTRLYEGGNHQFAHMDQLLEDALPWLEPSA